MSATTYVKMIKFNVTVGVKFKKYFKNTGFFKSILKLIRGFLKKTRDNLKSTSVKVVPLTVTSALK